MAGKTPMQKIADAGGVPLNAQPDKGKGSSVTLEGLQEKYGKKEGREIYFRAALAGGFGDFRNLSNLPPLDTTSLKGAHRDALDEVLAEADRNLKPAGESAEA